MKKLILSIVAMAATMGAVAEGYQVNTLSAKQEGMGHTGVALKLGAESMIFNPAGMAFMDKTVDLSASVSGVISDVSAVHEGIKYETNLGGLNKETLIIDNRSPATEVANKIMSDIEEVKDLIDSLIENVRLDAVEQRKIEEKYLSEASESIQVVIEITQKRIDALTKKLESITNK